MYKSEAYGKGGISAKVVADSISPDGGRLTTFELEYHRYIHSEFMTHRLLSRNAASSRAIPVAKMLERIRTTPAMPIHWGKNQSGMQAKEENNERVSVDQFFYDEEQWKAVRAQLTKEQAWMGSAEMACCVAEGFSEANYHKQIVNRLTEPFQFIKVVASATEWDNFFALRLHKDAQPEIQELARCMWEAREQSEPELLQPGEWHTPYVNSYDVQEGTGLPSERLYYINIEGRSLPLLESQALEVSASCCAQVSYRSLDTSIEKAMKIYDALVNSRPVHASPFEHQAQVPDWEDFDIGMDGKPLLYDMPEGVTHMDRAGNLWSGNFKGWIQYRQLIPGHVVTQYEGE